MRLWLSRSVLALLTSLLLASAACGAPPTGNQVVTTIPTAQPRGPEQAVLQQRFLSSAQLQSAYALILQRFVDRVDHGLLLEAAQRGLLDTLAEAGALPLDTDVAALGLKPSANPDRDWTAFARIFDALTSKYPQWALSVRLDHVVLTRMLEALADRHTLFITPEELRRRRETVYHGIGVRLSLPVAGQVPRIVEVFPDTPAAQAGLRPGDRILAVEGQSIAGMPLTKVVDLIRGPEGTAVTLDLERANATSALRVRLTRRAVEVPMVEAGMYGPIGYLRIRGFTEPVPPLVAAALSEGQRLGARAWVLDLRGNGGGRLDGVQQVAGMFLETKTIGIEVNRSRDRSPLTSRGPRLVADVPLAVLVDADTTSGAEILSAALREHLGAKIIGDRTGGNVAVAEEHLLPDGSAIQLTVRRFLSPSGGNIDRNGIQPDVAVPMNDADLASGRDPQLAKALEALQAALR